MIMKLVSWRLGELVSSGRSADARSESTHELTHSLTHQLAAAALGVLLVALVVSGCTRAHAKATPDPPDAPLDVPVPPPRDIEPADVEPPPPPAPIPETPRVTPPPPRPRPAPPREQPKPEPPKAEPEPVKPAEEPPRAPTTLQTAPTTAESDLERTIRATLARASAELNRIDYRGLNTDARTQYDTAKRFIHQAEDAVKAKNLVFAKNLADKAATISEQLRTR
jgi:outer membrane biosynthesis protein TonB